ncbi:hypothetical protein GGR56DRAFT_27521 [Xylariaceae sp. FL0804]|nr:hypothetical protein GGR56DRAFT_27521 [Xylariaceae sp. FL0804]
MLGQYGHIDTWRRDRLAEEPIYCSAPEPPIPGHLIGLGSDNGLDHDGRAAKRLRYEAQAQRFLQGKPIRLLSTSLTGPFDKASGWQNPWLPKPPNRHPRPNVAPPISNAPPAVKYLFGRHAQRPAKHDANTPTSQADNSMLCHLPSPQSQQEFNLSGSPLKSEERCRIEAWAKEVESRVPSKDAFWAPEQNSTSQHGEMSQGRPAAGVSWLKTKPPKRKRPLGSLETAASTPTPVQPVPSTIRAVSTSNGPTRKTSKVATEAINPSFEMTTPSSGSERGTEVPSKTHSGKLSANNPRNISKNDELPRSPAVLQHGNVSCTSGTGEQQLPPVLQAPLEQPFARNAQPQPHDQDPVDFGSQVYTTLLSKRKTQEPGTRQSDREQEVQDDTGFESCADQSFQYRVRPAKQATSENPGNDGVRPSQAPTQTETPESSRHDDPIILSQEPSVHGLSHLKGQTPSEGDCEDEMDSPVIQECDSHTYRESEPRSSAQAQSKEDAAAVRAKAEVPSISPTIPTTGACHRSNDIHIPPQTLLEVKLGLYQSADDEATTGSQSLVGDGTTLLGDQMDLDEPAAEERNDNSSNSNLPPDPNRAVCRDPASPQGDVGTDIKAKSCDKGFSGTPERDSDRSREPVGVSLSHSNQTTQATHESTQGLEDNVATDAVTSRPQIDKNPDERGEQTADPRSPEPVQADIEQSPWVPNPLPGGCLAASEIECKPSEEKPAAAHPIVMCPLSASTGIFESPAIRPSQQSPWSNQVMEPAVASGSQQSLVAMAQAALGRVAPARSEHQMSPFGEAAYGMPSPSERSADPWQPMSASSQPTQSADRPREAGFSTPGSQFRSSMAEPEVSIKSFAMFNAASSPRRRSGTPIFSSRSSRHRSILTSTTPARLNSSTKSNRRVSFASLPDEDGTALQLPTQKATRALSPPPESIPETHDVPTERKYQGHFNAMKKRSSSDAPRFRIGGTRILPSASQQRQTSPSAEAMAQAFREAEAHHEELIDTQDPIEAAATLAQEPGEERGDDAPQSPWQGEGQEVDDVAAVIGNLDEFLDAWDVEAEIAKARTEQEEHGEARVAPMPGVGIWG